MAFWDSLGQFAGKSDEMGVEVRWVGLDHAVVIDEKHQVDRQVDEPPLKGAGGQVGRGGQVDQGQSVGERLVYVLDLTFCGVRVAFDCGAFLFDAFLLGLHDLRIRRPISSRSRRLWRSASPRAISAWL
ncbi:MAG: hypothetical protein ACRDLF_00510 [Solirubrobacteraceae bacterium]